MSNKISTYITLTSAAIALLTPLKANAVCISALISITPVSSTLGFATLTPCTATPGQVILNQKNGTRTTQGCISNVSGATSLASVRVRALQASNKDKVEVTVQTVANINNSANSMSITNIELNKGNGATAIIIKGLDTKTIDIGGTLNVNGGQVGGTYTGAFTVDAHCQ